MISKAEVEAVIFRALRDATRDRMGSDVIEVSETTPLFGSEARVESLELVSLIVGVEGVLFEDYGLEVSLADDRALARTESPFSSVAALRDYVLELAQDV